MIDIKHPIFRVIKFPGKILTNGKNPHKICFIIMHILKGAFILR